MYAAPYWTKKELVDELIFPLFYSLESIRSCWVQSQGRTDKAYGAPTFKSEAFENYHHQVQN